MMSIVRPSLQSEGLKLKSVIETLLCVQQTQISEWKMIRKVNETLRSAKKRQISDDLPIPTG